MKDRYKIIPLTFEVWNRKYFILEVDPILTMTTHGAYEELAYYIHKLSAKNVVFLNICTQYGSKLLQCRWKFV